jgi:hypothetical protein
VEGATVLPWESQHSRGETVTSHVKRGLLAAMVAIGLLPTIALAQSAQPYSLQFSGLGSVPFAGGLTGVQPGPGWEAQIRYNPSAFSWGV